LGGPLVAYVTSLGVEAITGKPYKLTTGKNERFHQSQFRWPPRLPNSKNKSTPWDIIQSTQRTHQGMPRRITPLQAWDATTVAALEAGRRRRHRAGRVRRSGQPGGEVQ
jgi:hypothetical protein